MEAPERSGYRRLSLGLVLTSALWLWSAAAMGVGMAGAVMLVCHRMWEYLPLLVLFLILCSLCGCYLLGLKVVRSDDRALHIRGFFKRISVPYSRIADVHCEWFVGLMPFIKVAFKVPTPFGRRIRYLSRRSFTGWFPWVHPDTEYLQQKMVCTQNDEAVPPENVIRA